MSQQEKFIKKQIDTGCIWWPFNKKDQTNIRVLITRHWPRGKTWKELGIHLYMPELAPSRALLQQYKKRDGTQMSWNHFLTLFVAELGNLSNKKARRAFRLLDRLSQQFYIELLCYEEDGEPCHRYTVRDILVNDTWWQN